MVCTKIGFLNLASRVYPIAASGLALGLVLLGLTAIAMPGACKSLLNRLSETALRVFVAMVMLLLGIAMAADPVFDEPFAWSPEWYKARTTWRVLALCFAGAVFLKGAIWLTFPRVAERVIAWHTARSNLWIRLLGVLCLLLAYMAIWLRDQQSIVAPFIDMFF